MAYCNSCGATIEEGNVLCLICQDKKKTWEEYAQESTSDDDDFESSRDRSYSREEISPKKKIFIFLIIVLIIITMVFLFWPKSNIEILSVNDVWDEHGGVEITGQVKNIGNHEINIKYIAKLYDVNGNEIESKLGDWSANLQSGETDTYSVHFWSWETENMHSYSIIAKEYDGIWDSLTED